MTASPPQNHPDAGIVRKLIVLQRWLLYTLWNSPNIRKFSTYSPFSFYFRSKYNDCLSADSTKESKADLLRSLKRDEVPHRRVAICVRDTGIGINAEDLPQIMLPFAQVPSAQSGKHRGTGLGLPLTKGLAELRGGSFDIASTPGEGTTVTIRLAHAGHRGCWQCPI
jgi:hypothetical protein